jgi:hypothetical protein
VTHRKAKILLLTMNRERKMTLVTVHDLTTVMTEDTGIVASLIEYDSDLFALMEIFADTRQCHITECLSCMSHIKDGDRSIVLAILCVVHETKI